MIKKAAITFVALFLILVSLITLYAIDAKKNRGFTFGYYGEYNRIIEAIESLPEFELVKASAHHDVGLEEIWLELKVKDGEIIELFIGQNEKYRKLKGEDLADELKRRIQIIMSNKTVDTTAVNARLFHIESSKSNNPDMVAMTEAAVVSP